MIYVLDGSGFLYRSYFAMPKITNKDGREMWSVFGFFKMIIKLLKDRPDHFIIAWDSPKKTVRHEYYPEYKANRPPMEDSFKLQVGIIKDLVKEFGLYSIECPWYEADDIIATCVDHFKDRDDVVVVSSDKDIKQLIADNVIFKDTMKNVEIDKQMFFGEYGFWPDSMLLYLALLWDSSDNIPGVKGIWAITAQKLVSEYPTIEDLYNNLDKLTESIRKKLEWKVIKKLEFNIELIKLIIINDLNLGQVEDLSRIKSIKFDLMRKRLVEDSGFKSFEKLIRDTKNTIVAPVQQSLF